MSIKPLSLNLSKMKKIAGDEHSSTFLHPSGHHMVIAHHGVSALQRKQLEKMPVQKMAEGGDLKPTMGNVASNDDFGYMAKQLGGDPAAQQQAHDDAMASLPKTPDDPAAAAPVPAPEMAAPAEAPVEAQQPARELTQTSSVTPPQNPLAPAVDLPAAYRQGQLAISQQQAIDTEKSKAVAAIQEKDIKAREDLNKAAQDSLNEFKLQKEQFIKDYADNHINANHYLEDMGTKQKVATGIGLFLGGFSSGFTHQGNPALEMLNKQIDRDIHAQESRMDQQKTLFGAHQAFYHDDVIAKNQLRVNMNDIYDHQITLAAQKLGSPQAIAAANMAHADWAFKNNQLMQQNAMRSALTKTLSQATDPESKFRATTQYYRMMGNEAMAKDMEAKHVPGVGEASVPVTNEVREKLVAHKNLQDSINDLHAWTKAHTSLVPGTAEYNTGIQKSLAIQQLIRSGLLNTVYRTGEQPLLDKMVSGNPANLLKNFNTIPQLKELSLQNVRQYEVLKHAHGFPASSELQSQEPAQTQKVNGVEYVKVPGGWKRAK